MTKQENLFNLYGQLNKDGQRRDFQKHIANDCGVSPNTVIGHWFYQQVFPNYVTDVQLDSWIEYLQNKIALNNKSLIDG